MRHAGQGLTGAHDDRVQFAEIAVQKIDSKRPGDALGGHAAAIPDKGKKEKDIIRQREGFGSKADLLLQTQKDFYVHATLSFTDRLSLLQHSVPPQFLYPIQPS